MRCKNVPEIRRSEHAAKSPDESNNDGKSYRITYSDHGASVLPVSYHLEYEQRPTGVLMDWA